MPPVFVVLSLALAVTACTRPAPVAPNSTDERDTPARKAPTTEPGKKPSPAVRPSPVQLPAEVDPVHEDPGNVTPG